MKATNAIKAAKALLALGVATGAVVLDHASPAWIFGACALGGFHQDGHLDAGMGGEVVLNLADVGDAVGAPRSPRCEYPLPEGSGEKPVLLTEGVSFETGPRE